MEGNSLWIGVLLASCVLAIASAEKNVTEVVKQLKDNQTEAIAADSILGQITPLFSGYASLNQKVPIPVQFNCRNPKPLGGIASKSASAQEYVKELKYFIGDGWSPVLNDTAKGQHNESWALGLTWNSNCIEDSENVPECEMLFDAPYRASGGAQIKRTPAGGSVTFDKCSIFFDSTFLNSTTCFQEDSTTVAKVKAAFPENAIGNVIFYSSYNDTSPDGPPGTYTLSYVCQYAYNPVIQLNPGLTANPYNDAAAADPRTNAVFPYWMNGMFGGKGNGGNQGRKLLSATARQD